jgi:hypothetical protein
VLKIYYMKTRTLNNHQYCTGEWCKHCRKWLKKIANKRRRFRLLQLSNQEFKEI